MFEMYRKSINPATVAGREREASGKKNGGFRWENANSG
jgi:hypothetical protein